MLIWAAADYITVRNSEEKSAPLKEIIFIIKQKKHNTMIK